jgi:hypothetical protein
MQVYLSGQLICRRFCFSVHSDDNEWGEGGRTCLWDEQMKNGATDLKHVDGSQQGHSILFKPDQVLTKYREVVEICTIYFKFNQKKKSTQLTYFGGSFPSQKKKE